MKKSYCLDTGFFIQAWNLNYTPEICPSFWEVIAELAEAGKVFSPVEVLKELKKRDDSLYQWAKDQDNLFLKIGDDDAVETAFIEVINDEEGKRLIQHEKTRSPADPWLVAWCIVHDATLVTTEAKSTSEFDKAKTTKRKLPDVCDKFDVPWMNPSQFVHDVGINFTAKIL